MIIPLNNKLTLLVGLYEKAPAYCRMSSNPNINCI